MINDAISATNIEIVLINSYFDFSDYENPVKTYLDDRFLYNLVPPLQTDGKIFVKHNIAETQDQYIQTDYAKK